MRTYTDSNNNNITCSASWWNVNTFFFLKYLYLEDAKSCFMYLDANNANTRHSIYDCST